MDFVSSAVTDNYSVNVNMFSHLNDGVLHPVVKHPLQPFNEYQMKETACSFRPMFLSYDPVHILKNVRNQFLGRNLTIDGKSITPKFVTMIYNLQQTEVARSVRNLTQNNVNPNSMEKQKAKPAIDMFSKSLTGAIRMHAELHTPGFENVEPTVQFMELVHRWYAIHDTCNTTEFAFKRLPDKKPFYSSSDERLYFLEIEFPEMLRKWESEIQTSIQSIPCEEKKKIKDEKLKFLTKETYQTLLFTSLSTVQCVKYLLDELKFKFVLTRRLSSDNVEQFFGAVRQMAGGNSNCDAVSVSQSFEKILRTGIAETSVNGNTILRRETERNTTLLETTNPERKERAMSSSSCHQVSC